MPTEKIMDELDIDFEFSDEDIAESEPEEEASTGIPKEERILRTQAYDKSISDIIEMIKNGDIALDPSYQRNYLWDNKKASLLIESILLNVPIPVIYVAEDPDGVWNVVDGLQRLNSLNRFFGGEFKLRGLEVLSELNGSTYTSLNAKAQRMLRNGILRIILIFKESHPDIKYDIFMRLNRGAIKLNEQELRNCLYRGALNDLLKEERANSRFLELIGLSHPHKRFVDAELLLRYLTISSGYDQGSRTLEGYSGKLKSAQNRYCEANRNISSSQAIKLRTKIRTTIDKVFEVFGEKAFYKDSAFGVADSRMNRALMDCVMVGCEAYDTQSLILHKQELRGLAAKLSKKDAKFLDSITYGTSDKKKIEYRLSVWLNELKKIIE